VTFSFRAAKQEEIRGQRSPPLRREEEISPFQVSTQTRLNICKGAHPDVATVIVAVTTTTETRSLATADALAPDQAPVTTVAPANSKKAFASTATRRATSASTARKEAAVAAEAAATEALPETDGKAAAVTCVAIEEIASENAETTVATITGHAVNPESTAVKTVRATRDQPAHTREDPHAEATAAPTTRDGAAAAAWKSIVAGVSTARTTVPGADRPDVRPTEAKTISMSEIPLNGDQQQLSEI
jgi:hypothetical protein